MSMCFRITAYTVLSKLVLCLCETNGSECYGSPVSVIGDYPGEIIIFPFDYYLQPLPRTLLN